MRLLLDEMYPASIAEGLRARGHDVIAVVERAELRSLADPDLFAAAQSDGRAVVTENVVGHVAIVNDHDARGRAHHGLVLVHPTTYPRGKPSTIGMMISALDALAHRVGSGEATSLRTWL